MDEILCAAAGVSKASLVDEPGDMVKDIRKHRHAKPAVKKAAQLLWKALCKGKVVRFLPVGSLVAKLVCADEQTLEEHLIHTFQEGGRAIPESEWNVPLDKVGVRRAIGAGLNTAGSAVGKGFRKAGAAGKEVAKKKWEEWTPDLDLEHFKASGATLEYTDRTPSHIDEKSPVPRADDEVNQGGGKLTYPVME